jgi:hypothetical protein
VVRLVVVVIVVILILIFLIVILSHIVVTGARVIVSVGYVLGRGRGVYMCMM